MMFKEDVEENQTRLIFTKIRNIILFLASLSQLKS